MDNLFFCIREKPREPGGWDDGSPSGVIWGVSPSFKATSFLQISLLTVADSFSWTGASRFYASAGQNSSLLYLWIHLKQEGQFFVEDSAQARELHQHNLHCVAFSWVQSISRVRLLATLWTVACQVSLSITNPWSLLKLMSIELVMTSNHLILYSPFFPTFNLSQHQGLFQWVSSLHQVAKVLEFQLLH